MLHTHRVMSPDSQTHIKGTHQHMPVILVLERVKWADPWAFLTNLTDF